MLPPRERRFSWVAARLTAVVATACSGPVEYGPAGPSIATRLGDMTTPRSLHSATLLASGIVLLAGGGSPATAFGSAELYDPRTGQSRAIAPMTVPRGGHSATRLLDGRVLIVGGYGSGSAGAQSAELFDPATESFRAVGPPVAAHGDSPAAVLLSDGRVLIAGGDTSGTGATPTSAAEVFDPLTERFTAVGSMHVSRRVYGALPLADGRVLVPGGTTDGKRVVASAETFDPASGAFSFVGSLAVARHKHAAAVLLDGRVVVAGGTEGGDDSRQLASVETFDPVSSRFAASAPMTSSRYKFSLVAISGGRLLAVGGATALVEVLGGGALSASSPDALRFFSSATPLEDGAVLVCGGYGSGGASAAVWRVTP